MVDVVRKSRTVRFDAAMPKHEDVEPMFRDLLEREDFGGAVVLDLGTGTGRLAFFIAPRARKVIGVDIDESAVSVARDEAIRRDLSHAEFVVADAESAPWSAWYPGPYDFVTANLFMSEGVVALAGRHLRRGGRLLFCAHHTDHWRETRKGSRWAMGEDRMAALLVDNGFAIEFLGVDTTTELFDGVEQVEAVLSPRRLRTWTEDGRWAALREAFAAGRRQLTRSYLVGRAQTIESSSFTRDTEARYSK